MSTRRFCDQCQAEMTAGNTPFEGTNKGRLEASIGHLSVEVVTRQNQVSNSGDYCTHCILDALYRLDDRPKAGAKEST